MILTGMILNNQGTPKVGRLYALVTNRLFLLLVCICAFVGGIYFAKSPRNQPSTITEQRDHPKLNSLSEEVLLMQDQFNISADTRTPILPTDFSDILYVHVQDEGSLAVANACVEIGYSAEDLLRNLSCVFATDSAGTARVELARDDCLPWLFVYKEGYDSYLASPFAKIWRKGGEFSREITVKLAESLPLSIVVRNRLARPVVEAHISAVSRWGWESRHLNGSDPLSRQLCPTAVSDHTGTCLIHISPNYEYEVVCDSPGYEPEVRFLSQQEIEDGTVFITLNALVLGGILIPTAKLPYPVSGGHHSQFNLSKLKKQGVRDTRNLNSHQKNEIFRNVERQLLLSEESIKWFLATEKDPTLYPAEAEVWYIPLPGEEGCLSTIKMKRVQDLSLGDLYVVPYSTDCGDWAQIKISFVCKENPEYIPPKNEWALFSLSHPGHSFGVPSPARKRDNDNDLNSSQSCVFYVPPGKYEAKSIMLGMGAPLFDPVAIEVHANDTISISIECSKKIVTRGISVVDIFGRHLHRWYLSAVDSNRKIRRTLFKSTLEHQINEISLPLGNYEFILSCFGYKKTTYPCKFALENEGTTMDIIVVQS